MSLEELQDALETMEHVLLFPRVSHKEADWQERKPVAGLASQGAGGWQSRACHILGFSPCLESSVPWAPWHSLWGISSRRRSGQADAHKAHHEPLFFGGPGDPSWEGREVWGDPSPPGSSASALRQPFLPLIPALNASSLFLRRPGSQRRGCTGREVAHGG